MERQIGRKLEELEGPEFPTLLLHVWSAFLSLAADRTNGPNGPNPITYEQIKTWKELVGHPLSTRDVELVKRLDTVFTRVMYG